MRHELKMVQVMKKFFLIFVAAIGVLASCQKDGDSDGKNPDGGRGYRVGHEMMVLGDCLENPYAVSNMEKALSSVYPTKAGTHLGATHNYVRFLPMTAEEAEDIYNLGLVITDYPLDYEIIVDGDYYHDPAVNPEQITYLYAVAPVDFDFGDVRYELITPCYIVGDGETKGADGIDWSLVEKRAFELTGNADWIAEDGAGLAGDGTGDGAVAGAGDRAVAGASKGGTSLDAVPMGQITMSDPSYNDGKPFAVKGVKVQCNVFVKYASCYTDDNGRYKMDKSFKKNPRYRLVFENRLGFAQGFNRILVRGSTSAIGYFPPSGVNVCVTPSSESNAYRRCAINNAAYDYYQRCDVDDMGISLPPADLRIWTITILKWSVTPMAHHGALTEMKELKQLLGEWAFIVDFFLPDIVLGLSNSASYSDICAAVNHELAHASHYSVVRNGYWTDYIKYILTSYIKEGFNYYGSGELPDAGLCEVSEMWAFFLSSIMQQERYGGAVPPFGNQFWFRPQIYRYMFERGITRKDIFKAMTPQARCREDVWNNLLEARYDDRDVINSAFSQYEE